MVEYYMPTPYFALVRFGRWQEMLAEPAPPADLQYDTAMWHYAPRHRRGRQRPLRRRQRRPAPAIKALADQIPADRIVGDNQRAGALLHLASLSLAGEIAARQGDCETAIGKLEESVSVQDGLPYMEPPPWYMPQRQALGATLLGCGRAYAAEQVFREDLRRNPDNGWSLLGLAQSLRAEGDEKGAAQAEAQFRTAWQRADVQLAAAKF